MSKTTIKIIKTRTEGFLDVSWGRWASRWIIWWNFFPHEKWGGVREGSQTALTHSKL